VFKTEDTHSFSLLAKDLEGSATFLAGILLMLVSSEVFSSVILSLTLLVSTGPNECQDCSAKLELEPAEVDFPAVS